MENDSMFGFHCTEYGEKNTAHWLSWLERRPVTAEVDGSSPFWVVFQTGILHGNSCKMPVFLV